jgi:hypothetical protein
MRKKVFARLAVAGAVTVGLAAAAVGLVAVRQSRESRSLKARADAIVSKKDVETIKAGKNAEAVIGADENRKADSSADVEAYLLRAYPAAEVPGEATLAAQSGWAALNAGAHSAGSWQLIGPAKATYPAVLNPFLFDGAQYVTSGRVTAMAISPTCTQASCTLYVAAAGGGVWRTDKALTGSNWRFVSGGFGINAIGSLLIDPSDPSEDTLYAGTGESNASGDSEAGVGIYKTTNGGATWALVPGSDIFFQRGIGQMAFDNAGNLLVPIISAVRGYSSVTSGASSSGATGHPLATRGLYRQTGATFTLIRPIVAVATARGSTTVKVDPTHPGVIYVNEFSRGIWRSLDNGTTWTQIKTPLNAGRSTDCAEFDVATLPNGNTRMYVGVGNQTDAGANRARFYRTDDASGAAVFADMTTDQNIGYCTGQCWYDNVVYTPPGAPDVVYLGGSFSYGQLHAQSNGRAWLLSTNGGTSFNDLTQDADPNRAEGIHPDSHAIATVPGKPLQFITGGDGGVVRSDGRFADISAKCNQRGLSAADNALCKSLLNRVANQLVNMNNGLSTLQFQSLSVAADNPKHLQGGTQDNGTFETSGSPIVWPQIIYGDGGQSGFNAANSALRFNTFTGQANDANFRNGDPTKWVIISAPILSSPEGAFFYPPIIADPNPAMAGSIFQGSFSVWRTQDWGGDRDYLEANCPEFTTSAVQPGCGDFVRIGNGVPSTDLSEAAWGNRAGGAVAWLARAPQNTGTMWAATSTGRVFITDNANDPAASVVWHRADPVTNDPGRAISQIYVDPTSAHHAWISYNGYNVNTPATQGHVFEVTWSGSGAATWVDLSYNLPDFPITAVVSDDVTGDLYAASDFGVMRLARGSTTWTVAGAGLPMVEVPGLTIVPSARLLYAATHGRSAWTLKLP